ncbi:hypothetical protein CAPTEDRAFT_205846 [Capitella teleta]|uniref:Uncharacterized protein n=1 Tax=Capitella teleta TaxID=283909 RepID=R7TPN8_CAPTE|nr:hypothetical protein CAPTEDRAFT_205846 [Capitella teleta]|eukprot:ELT95823.1 hypothetical protein CAPTEDRAFT_205846 [Capitella teleta]
MESRNKKDYFSQRECEACVKHIKDCYHDYIFKTIEEGGASRERHYIRPCKFHTALLANTDFVLEVLSHLQKDEIDYIFSALVDYTIPRDSETRSNQEVRHPVLSDFNISEATREELIKRHSIKRYQLVAGLVAYGGCTRLMKHLLQFGLNVRQKDVSGNTILHLLVDISEDKPQHALKMYEIVMTSLPDDAARKGLASELNSQMKTALDLACSRWLPEMMYALFNTRGVYKYLVAHTATHNYFYYDITEYEYRKFNRGLTPLHHLSVVPEKQLKRLQRFQLLQKEPFATWIQELFHACKNVTRSWFVGWTMTVISYMAGLFYVVKKDASHAEAVNIIIIFGAALGALSDAFTISSTIPYYKLIVYNIRQVILLNLMIAIMNQRMVELVDQKKSLVGIAQLAINIFAEDRLIYSQQTFGRSARAKEKYLVKKDGKSFLCTAEPCC